MKKSVFILVFFILSISFVWASEMSSYNLPTSNKIYSCLNDKINNKCSSLSVEERIFSLLALSQCKAEIKDESDNGECWPKYGCDVKTTAEAILALKKSNSVTKEMKDWLKAQTKNPSELEWYLQIESSEPTSCEISYDLEEYTIVLDDDKKINRQAGKCLPLAEDGYWLKVSPGCYDTEFSISCNEPFFTNLLYKKKASSEIFISEKTNSASTGGVTLEKINSFCFTDTSSCNYEASLWATLALKSIGSDITPYKPYLFSMAEENKKYLPYSFLSLITDSKNFQDTLLSQQKTDYWDESGDKFYDTAVALLAFQGQSTTEKTNTLNWLLEIQDSDGCWKGNLKNTAFLLYAGWLKNSDFSAVSSVNVTNLENCSELGGEICSYGEECEDEEVPSKEGDCCLGDCKKKPVAVESKCENMSGLCKTNCLSNEEAKNYSCENSYEKCCFEKVEKDYTLIWVFAFLIILVVIGIIFRDKLRPYWFKLKSSFNKGSSSPNTPTGPGPRFPPTSSFMTTSPRRIFPSQSQIQKREISSTKPKTKQDQEFLDVLKKLKEMGGG